MPNLPVKTIWEIASFNRAIRSKVALELVVSWPIPSYGEGRLGFWFFYHSMFGPPPAKTFRIYPPSWRVWIAASDGAVLDLSRIRPQDAGLNVKEGEPFAEHGWPEEWTVKTADEKRLDLLAAYDRVLPIWETKRRSLLPAETREVTSFLQKFRELTPPALLPCYRFLGGEFFGWVGL